MLKIYAFILCLLPFSLYASEEAPEADWSGYVTSFVTEEFDENKMGRFFDHALEKAQGNSIAEPLQASTILGFLGAHFPDNPEKICEYQEQYVPVLLECYHAHLNRGHQFGDDLIWDKVINASYVLLLGNITNTHAYMGSKIRDLVEKTLLLKGDFFGAKIWRNSKKALDAHAKHLFEQGKFNQAFPIYAIKRTDVDHEDVISNLLGAARNCVYMNQYQGCRDIIAQLFENYVNPLQTLCAAAFEAFMGNNLEALQYLGQLTGSDRQTLDGVNFMDFTTIHAADFAQPDALLAMFAEIHGLYANSTNRKTAYDMENFACQLEHLSHLGVRDYIKLSSFYSPTAIHMVMSHGSLKEKMMLAGGISSKDTAGAYFVAKKIIKEVDEAHESPKEKTQIVDGTLAVFSGNKRVQAFEVVLKYGNLSQRKTFVSSFSGAPVGNLRPVILGSYLVAMMKTVRNAFKDDQKLMNFVLPNEIEFENGLIALFPENDQRYMRTFMEFSALAYRKDNNESGLSAVPSTMSLRDYAVLRNISKMDYIEFSACKNTLDNLEVNLEGQCMSLAAVNENHFPVFRGRAIEIAQAVGSFQFDSINPLEKRIQLKNAILEKMGKNLMTRAGLPPQQEEGKEAS